MKMQILLVFVTFQIIYGRRTIEEKQALNDGCYDGVCWEDDDYPAAKIMEKLLLSDRSNLDTFGKHDDNVIIEVPEKSCDLCERTLSLKITPLTITRSNKKYFVVNTGNYQQKITYNICKPDEEQNNSKCKGNIDILPKDFLPACEQKNTMIRLLCYDPENDKFVGQGLIYPSACVCTIKEM